MSFFHLKHVSMEPQNSSLPTNYSFLSSENLCLCSGLHRWWSPMNICCGWCFLLIKCSRLPSSPERPRTHGPVGQHHRGPWDCSFITYLLTFIEVNVSLALQHHQGIGLHCTSCQLLGNLDTQCWPGEYSVLWYGKGTKLIRDSECLYCRFLFQNDILIVSLINSTGTHVNYCTRSWKLTSNQNRQGPCTHAT
jgi:hypothetical protein